MDAKIRINDADISETTLFFITELITKIRNTITSNGWYLNRFDRTDKTVMIEIERSIDHRKVTMETSRSGWLAADELSGVYWTIKDADFEIFIREPITKLLRLFRDRRLDYDIALKELKDWQSESAKATWQTAVLSDD